MRLVYYVTSFAVSFRQHLHTHCVTIFYITNPKVMNYIMTVYADVLICINIIIDYFLLSLTSKLLKIRCSFKRQLVAAAAGGICSLAILIPLENIFASVIIRAVTSVAVVLAAYGVGTAKQIFKRIVVFYLASFVFSGLMFALWQFKPYGLLVQNGVVYYNISAVVLVAVAAATYFCICLSLKFIKRNNAPTCKLLLKEGKTETEITALVDSGNRLKEPFSEKQVLLLDPKYSYFFSDSQKPQRVIPYKTVSGEGIIKGYIPDSLMLIKNEHNTETEQLDMYIALSPTPFEKDYGAVMSADAI